MEYHIVETAVDLCDIADALVYIGRGGISDVIIDQRKIRLEKRCDDDASVICQLVFVIIDIDNVSVVADIVVIFAGRFDDTAAGSHHCRKRRRDPDQMSFPVSCVSFRRPSH